MAKSSLAEPFKRCTTCPRYFPKTTMFFLLRKDRSLAFSSQCRTCLADDKKRHYAEHRIMFLEQQRRRRQNNLEKARRQGRETHHKHRAKHNASARARYHANAEEERAKARARRAKNPDYGRTYRKEYRKTHPQTHKIGHAVRKARKKNLPTTFTPADWHIALQYWHYACAVCGREEGFYWTLSADHWIPLASPRSPGTVPTNIIPLCHTKYGNQHSCNTTKNSRDPKEWVFERLGKQQSAKKLKEITAYFDHIRMRLTPGGKSTHAS